MDYQFGTILVFAIIAALFISIIAYKGINKDKKARAKYDERQQALRGKSFTFGFYAMVAASIAFMIMHLFGLGDFWGPFGYCTIMIIGVIVQMTYAIFNDAYLGLNTNARKYMIFMSIVSLVNIVAAVMGIADGSMFEGGVLHESYTNLLCSILFAVLVIDLGIKRLIDKKEK